MNKAVFDVYLCSKRNHDCCANLTLPATMYELLDARDKVRAQTADSFKLSVEACHIFPQAAPFLEDATDLMALNALSERLAGLDAQESAIFAGLVEISIQKREPFGVPHLINLACSTDRCHIVAEARDDAALGKFYAENGFAPELDKLPDAVFKLLDFQKIGNQFRTGEFGVFTGGGYVVQHTELAEAYKDMELTLKAPEYTILLEISKGQFTDTAYDNEKTVRLPLPAEPAAMDAALTAIAARDWQEADILCVDCRAPALIPHIDGNCNIAHINRLAQRLQSMTDAEASKFKAVLDATKNYSVLDATNIAFTLDDYILTPQYSSPEAMARDYLKCGMGASSATLMPYVNLYLYGRALMGEQNCALTEYGMVSRRDGQRLEAASEPIEAEQGGMEMM